MKKILGSLICAGALVSSINAYERLEFDYSFKQSWNFNLSYKNYNNQNNLIYSGSIEYEDWGLKGRNTSVVVGVDNDAYELYATALVGKTMYLHNKDDSTFGVNLLGGLELLRYTYDFREEVINGVLHRAAKGSNNSLGLKVLLNISGIYDKNIIYDADLSYVSYFGDSKKHIIEYKIGAGYKFTQNVYAKANISLATEGEKEKNNSTTTALGFAIGYEF